MSNCSQYIGWKTYNLMLLILSSVVFYHWDFFYFVCNVIPEYLTNKNTRNAVIKKSINVDITLPYNTHLYERSSICFTLSLLRIGLRIIGVIKFSINHFTSSQTLVAINNQIAIPKILYWERNPIKSVNIAKNKKIKRNQCIRLLCIFKRF